MSNQRVVLWSGEVPGAKDVQEADRPSMAYYPATGPATGAAMVIFPGGGYWGLAPHEGHDYALFLNQAGVSCFVVTYRLAANGYRHPCMLWDAARALRTVRARSSEWGVDPHRIGVMGSSAGGHLAATLLTQYDAGQAAAPDPIERVSSRPDLGILCYPVISAGPYAHQGSFTNLLGAGATEEERARQSAELNVSAETPPCFVWHTLADAGVPVENSLLFAQALRRFKVPFDLHIYQEGGHGIGLQDTFPFPHPHPWSRDLLFWLGEQGFIAREGRGA